MMPRVILGYISAIDAMNRFIERIAMYLISVLIAVLLWSSVSKVFLTPTMWTLETAQFVMVAYFVLGGPTRSKWARMCAWIFSTATGPEDQGVGRPSRSSSMLPPVSCFMAGWYRRPTLGYFGNEPFDFLLSLVGTFFTEGTAAAGDKLGFLERSPTAWRLAVHQGRALSRCAADDPSISCRIFPGCRPSARGARLMS